MYVCVNNRWKIRERERQRHAVLWFCIMYYCMTLTMYSLKNKIKKRIGFIALALDHVRVTSV